MRTTPGPVGDELYGSEEGEISIRNPLGMSEKKKQLIMLQKCKEVTAATVQRGGIQQTITWSRKLKKKQLITTRHSFCANSQ